MCSEHIFKYFVSKVICAIQKASNYSHWLFLDIHHTMLTCTFTCSFLERNNSFLISYMDAYGMMFQAKQTFSYFSRQSTAGLFLPAVRTLHSSQGLFCGHSFTACGGIFRCSVLNYAGYFSCMAVSKSEGQALLLEWDRTDWNSCLSLKYMLTQSCYWVICHLGQKCSEVVLATESFLMTAYVLFSDTPVTLSNQGQKYETCHSFQWIACTELNTLWNICFCTNLLIDTSFFK